MERKSTWTSRNCLFVHVSHNTPRNCYRLLNCRILEPIISCKWIAMLPDGPFLKHISKSKERVLKCWVTVNRLLFHYHVKLLSVYYLLVARDDVEMYVEPSVCKFPFSFMLSSDLPQSSECSYGSIRYKAKAVIDRQKKINDEAEVLFNVIRTLDLNKEPPQLRVSNEHICDFPEFLYFCNEWCLGYLFRNCVLNIVGKIWSIV